MSCAHFVIGIKMPVLMLFFVVNYKWLRKIQKMVYFEHLLKDP